MNPYYPLVSLRAGHRCEYCRAPEVVFNCAFEVEHIIPIALGGGDELENLALACRGCNLRKSSHLNGTDPATAQEVRLFNPRTDEWENDLRFDAETSEIQGLTPIGRATVVRLDMNSEAQRTARRQWIRLGAYP